MNTDTRSEWAKRIGVGERQPTLPTKEPRKRAVVADDGPLRGKTVGFATDHKDGRVDATATKAVMYTRPLTIKRETDA